MNEHVLPNKLNRMWKEGKILQEHKLQLYPQNYSEKKWKFHVNQNLHPKKKVEIINMKFHTNQSVLLKK